MAHRMIVTAEPPRKSSAVKQAKVPEYKSILVALGDPSMPDKVKVDGKFNQEDFEDYPQIETGAG